MADRAGELHLRRATSFGVVAGAYERGRPGYPPDAIHWLTGEPPLDVVDLAAGTGKLTRGIVALGHRVTAVEPLDEMRAQLVEAVPGIVDALKGTAESMPLPDESADVVTIAQAFHWFDHERAVPEIARVLRPAGRIAIVWNVRDDRLPWMRRLSELIEAEGLDEEVWPSEIGTAFAPLERATFAFEQPIDRQLLLDLVASRSQTVVMPEDERIELLAAVSALYDEEAAGGSPVVMPYRTECFRALRL